MPVAVISQSESLGATRPEVFLAATKRLGMS